MREKLIQIINLLTLSKSDKDEYKEEIFNYNRNTLQILCSVGVLVATILVILSLPFIGVLELFEAYVLMDLFFIAALVIVTVVGKKTPKLVRIFYYILISFIYSLSIYMGTYLSLNTNSTTLLICMLLLPLFLIDKPYRIILLNFTFAIIFIVADLYIKAPGQIRFLDVSNVVAVFFISSVLVIFGVHRSIGMFTIQRKEQGRVKKMDDLINDIPVGVAVFEVFNGNIKQTFTNDEFYRLVDDTPEARTKRSRGNFINSIHPDDRMKVRKEIKAVIDNETDYLRLTCRTKKGDGSYIWVRFSSYAAERKGSFIKVYSTYANIEEEMKSKQATQAKTEFLSRMSHDIRTPMNAIIGMTQLAREENDITTINEYLDNIKTSSDFLLGLINDILDLSKIESGQFELHERPYTIKEFREGIETIMKPMIEGKNINFECNANIENACFLIDKLRFHQIFFNLLSNACKFTSEGGKISCTQEAIEPKGDLFGMKFTVSDTGKGMSKEFQKNMFDSFAQENAMLDESYEGTGLGLPIVKSLVDEMGGTISVNSELGVGTTYVLKFYFKQTEYVENKDEVKEYSNNLRGKEILLTEDNNMNILVAKKLLENAGMKVTVSRNGKEAVEAFKNSEIGFFKAILMDIRMPVMDGLAASELIRSLARADARRIPIIAVTADAFTEEQKKSYEAGMNYHLSKPLKPDELFDVMARYIK